MTPVPEGLLAFAAGAGLGTFLSPCALPLVPGYVGYYVSASAQDTPRAGLAVRALAAAGGVLVTLLTLGGLAVLVGQPVARALPTGELLVGAVLLVLGVAVLTDRGPDWQVPLPARRADTAGFALFGAGYAVAGAGCVLPVFLGVVLEAMTLGPAAGTAVVGTYAAAVALPLLGLTVAVGAGFDAITARLTSASRYTEPAAGIVLVAAGLGQLLVVLFPDLTASLPQVAP